MTFEEEDDDGYPHTKTGMLRQRVDQLEWEAKAWRWFCAALSVLVLVEAFWIVRG